MPAASNAGNGATVIDNLFAGAVQVCPAYHITLPASFQALHFPLLCIRFASDLLLDRDFQ